MKLSRTAAYAVQAMVFVAQQGVGPPLIARVVADKTDIPYGFLYRIMVALARAQLLRSLKGPSGGYSLGRPAKDITLLEIVEAAEGPMSSRVDHVASPPDAVDEKLQGIAEAITDSMRKELGRVTLAELANGKKSR